MIPRLRTVSATEHADNQTVIATTLSQASDHQFPLHSESVGCATERNRNRPTVEHYVLVMMIKREPKNGVRVSAEGTIVGLLPFDCPTLSWRKKREENLAVN